MSDAFAVGSLVTQGFAENDKDAALRGATAGVNMDMGSTTYLEQMKSLLDKGQLTASQLDDLVRPILAAKYHLGLFEHPYADATEPDPFRDAGKASSDGENRSGTFCGVAAERRRSPPAGEDYQTNCGHWTAG